MNTKQSPLHDISQVVLAFLASMSNKTGKGRGSNTRAQQTSSTRSNLTLVNTLTGWVISLGCPLRERRAINFRLGKRSGGSWDLRYLHSRIRIGRGSRPKKVSAKYEQSFEDIWILSILQAFIRILLPALIPFQLLLRLCPCLSFSLPSLFGV